jgi:hypothetical protein
VQAEEKERFRKSCIGRLDNLADVYVPPCLSGSYLFAWQRKGSMRAGPLPSAYQKALPKLDLSESDAQQRDRANRRCPVRFRLVWFHIQVSIVSIVSIRAPETLPG